jgi:uncharacterized protein YjbI with pentapeptide repeats
MSIGADWPISIMATQDVACGARLWSTSGQLRATLIVKATFALVDGGPMRLVAPAPLATTDEFAGGDPQRSLLIPSDVVPYRPRGEVLFVGHAHAPSGQPSPSLTAHLSVIGQRPLVDKSIHVFGERVLLDDGQASQPVPFTRMPILYERTIASADENPIGMVREVGAPVPNLVDPLDPTSPAGFGAIPPHWATRRRMLRSLDPSAVEASVPDIPAAFAWSYFQAAPPDQRCAFFDGGEWLVLDALHPDKPRFESQLPGARAAARLYSTGAMTTYREFPLVADTLFIDGDRGLVCLVWRGNLDVDRATVGEVQALAGLELPGRPIPWPQTSVLQAPAQPSAPSMRASDAGVAARSASTSGMPAVTGGAPMPARSPSQAGFPAVSPGSMSPPAPSPAASPPQPSPHASTSGMQAVQPTPGPQRSPSSSGMPAVQPGPPSPRHSPSQAAMPSPHASTSGMPAAQLPPRSQSTSAMPAVTAPTSPPMAGHEVVAPNAIPPAAGPVAAPPPAQAAPPVAYTVASPVDVAAAAQATARVPATLIGSNAQVLAAVAAMPVVEVIAPPPPSTPEPGSAGAPAVDPASTTVTVPKDVLRAAIEASVPTSPGGAGGGAPPLEPHESDEPNTRIVSPAALESLLASPMSELGVPTIPRPLAATAPSPVPPESLNPTTMRRPRFDDPETYQPDSGAIARIVQEAEAQLGARPPSASPPTVAAGEQPTPFSAIPTPHGIPAVEGSHEARHLAATARARADAAAQEGAALAREHIAAGAMTKVRPPRTTIRGLADPARASSPSVHEEETNRAAETQRYDAPTTTKPGGERLAELMQKANRGDFPPLDEPAPTRQFETASLQAALGALEAEAAADPGAAFTAISPVFPVRTVPEPGAPSSRKPLSSPPERLSITNAVDMVSLMRPEVTRRIQTGESLAGLMLEGADLSGLDLRGRDFSGARLKGASLRNARLDGANLSGAVLDEADLTRATLDGANLSRASVRAAIFNDATLRATDATEACFEGAIGTSAALEGIVGERALFVGARFDCARFDNAKLEGADFTEAIIDGASFESAVLREARFYEARAEAASFVRATLTGARLDASVMVRGRFQSAEAADSLWDQAELDQASFDGAKLAGASFIKSSCRETSFASADLAEARFNRSILWGARFVNVDMASANFDGADTRGAVFAQGSLPPGAAPTGRPPGG